MMCKANQKNELEMAIKHTYTKRGYVVGSKIALTIGIILFIIAYLMPSTERIVKLNYIIIPLGQMLGTLSGVVLEHINSKNSL